MIWLNLMEVSGRRIKPIEQLLVSVSLADSQM